MTHLMDRLVRSKAKLAPVHSRYCVVFEDPAEPDSPACVMTPDPHWLAAALAGDVLPPIEAYLHDQNTPNGSPKIHPYADPIGPMTEEQAIEYLIQKDVPPRVWRDYKGNRCIMRIVPMSAVPSDRTFRDAWRMVQEQEMAA